MKRTEKPEAKISRDFIVGCDYGYSKIPQESTDELDVKEYGPDAIGQNAIHLKYYDKEIDVWFILDGYAHEGIFKCVYNK